MLNIQEGKLTKRGFAFKVWVFLWVSLLLLSNRFHSMFAEAEEMSWPLGEMVSVKERADKLIEELKTISKRAFGMALSVHKDPALRTQLAGEAHVLENRLLDIAKELEKIDRASHKQWVFPISESILDLNFVLADSGTTSLRLGDIIHWGTRPGRWQRTLALSRLKSH